MVAVCAVQATSALDVESEAQVQAALDRAMRASGRSVLVIAHRRAQTLKSDPLMHIGRRPGVHGRTYAEYLVCREAVKP